jgi:hypothetical protein
MPYLGRSTAWSALGVTVECVPSGEESALGEVFGDIFEDELLMKVFDDGKDGMIGTPQAILARASVPPNSSALELSERDNIASEVLTEGDVIQSKELLPNWAINCDIDVSVS